jgi:hypothetical protein
MHANRERLNIKNGILNTVAILLISITSGCAVNPTPNNYAFDDPFTIDPPRGPIMFINDLNYFQIDCENKDEQVQLLQSMRRTKVEIMKAKFMANFRSDGPIPSERSNWMVNQHLLDLRNLCH